jgi:hypothetical protein
VNFRSDLLDDTPVVMTCYLPDEGNWMDSGRPVPLSIAVAPTLESSALAPF